MSRDVSNDMKLSTPIEEIVCSSRVYMVIMVVQLHKMTGFVRSNVHNVYSGSGVVYRNIVIAYGNFCMSVCYNYVGLVFL